MKVILIGFMGSGKSSVARELNRIAGLVPIELDQLALGLSGCPDIATIFDAEGEDTFRKLESQALAELNMDANSVLSCGGGVLKRSENWEKLRRHNALIVYLKADFDTVLERVRDSRERPLIRDLSAAYELFIERLARYQSFAHATLETDELSIEQAALKVLAIAESLSPKSRVKIVKPPRMILGIGDPIAHSLSPQLHAAAYSALDLEQEYIYLRTRVPSGRLQETIAACRKCDVHAITCTIPHKEAVLRCLDRVDSAAREIGAVNTVLNRGGELCGYNTDWLGINAALEQAGSLTGEHVAILGAGGAARAAIYACRKAGAEITVFNRTLAKAQDLAKEFGVQAAALDNYALITPCDLIFNTTALGLHTVSNESPLPSFTFRSEQVVIDVHYAPVQTTLLRQAQAAGARTIGGDVMFVHQAAAQFKLYAGSDAPLEVMINTLRQIYPHD